MGERGKEATQQPGLVVDLANILGGAIGGLDEIFIN
jgi:hypothetical protein